MGTIQGPCRVESVVAEGGFGVVYRAFHETFQAPVAMKCLKIPGQLDEASQREFLDKFKEEAALMFKLSASIPTVVRPLHVDIIQMSDGRFVPYMAMEWLDGEGLEAFIARRAQDGQPPLGMRKAVRLLTPVARALARAHHFSTPEGPISIVHRDLKPENIFLARINNEEVIKIFDFGIAKARSVASQAAGRLSQSGQVAAFTPGYGAPEQWLPKRFGQSGPWTDVFGLALTALEAALGRPIIDGDTAGMMGTACDEKRRPTPRNEGAEVSDQVEAVFMAALAVDPRNRYPDAGQFWDALETALGLDLSSTPTMSNVPRRSAFEESSVSLPRAAISAASGLGLRELESTGSGPIPELELDLPVPPSRQASASSRAGMAPMSRPASIKNAPLPPPPGTPVPDKSLDDALANALDGLDSSNAPSIDLDLSSDPSRRASNGGRPVSAAGNRPPSISGNRPASISNNPNRPSAVSSGAYPRSVAEAPASSSPRGAPSVAVRGTNRAGESPSMLARLRLPMGIAGAGLALAIIDRIVVATLDNDFHLGPIRLSWVAAALTVVGVVVAMKRLVFAEDER